MKLFFIQLLHGFGKIPLPFICLKIVSINTCSEEHGNSLNPSRDMRIMAYLSERFLSNISSVVVLPYRLGLFIMKYSHSSINLMILSNLSLVDHVMFFRKVARVQKRIGLIMYPYWT